MKWSWKIARIAGIDVHLHATFLLLPALYALGAYQSTGSPRAALAAVGAILLVFAIVVLHEFGHALAARRYGIPTADITLLPIGGVARLQSMPKEPKQELVIALAGPAVNAALAVLFAAALALTDGATVDAMTAPADARFFSRGLLVQLQTWNLSILLFNLIPAFPLDGGRVLRALLAMRLPYPAATVAAARVGRAIAVFGGLAGWLILRNPMLVLIALFVWLGAAGEAGAVQSEAALEDVSLERVMMTDVRTLRPDQPLADAVRLVLDGFQQDFPVQVDDGAIIGLLTRADLLRALAERGEATPVWSVMRREFPHATLGEPVDAVLARLRDTGSHALPVLRGRALLGMVSSENVSEFLMIRAARARHGAPGDARGPLGTRGRTPDLGDLRR